VTIIEQIRQYIDQQPVQKRNDLYYLHHWFISLMPDARQWFLDGRNEEGKVVSNPNIGYGHYTIRYANGTTRDFYQIGLSANTAGISVYIMGLEDKNYLSDMFAKAIGKAKVTGYCIRFKALKDIDLEVLSAAVRYGLSVTAS